MEWFKTADDRGLKQHSNIADKQLKQLRIGRRCQSQRMRTVTALSGGFKWWLTIVDDTAAIVNDSSLTIINDYYMVNVNYNIG